MKTGLHWLFYHVQAHVCAMQALALSLIGAVASHLLKINKNRLAKTAFVTLKHIPTNGHLAMKSKIRVLEYYVLAVMLYGVETWTISKVIKKRLEAA